MNETIDRFIELYSESPCFRQSNRGSYEHDLKLNNIEYELGIKRDLLLSQYESGLFELRHNEYKNKEEYMSSLKNTEDSDDSDEYPRILFATEKIDHRLPDDYALFFNHFHLSHNI